MNIKSNYLSMKKRIEEEVTNNEELCIEVLNLANAKAALMRELEDLLHSDYRHGDPSSELDRVRAVVNRLSTRKVHLLEIFTSIREGPTFLSNLPCTMPSRGFLPPAKKLGQGYIFTGVCDSVHRGGAWSGGCLLPGECLVWRGAWSWVGGACSRGVLLLGGAWWRPPGTATAAGGMHPIGMHSCFCFVFFFNFRPMI